jgi:5-formyltetrahydrofolate cyclo-ligase
VAWWRLRQMDTVGVYWPLAGEPDLRAAYAELALAGVRLALPVVMERNAPLAFTEWTLGRADAGGRDGGGGAGHAALHRAPACPADSLPGLQCRGYRLGYGGGYYDRTLELLCRARSPWASPTATRKRSSGMRRTMCRWM